MPIKRGTFTSRGSGGDLGAGCGQRFAKSRWPRPATPPPPHRSREATRRHWRDVDGLHEGCHFRVTSNTADLGRSQSAGWRSLTRSMPRGQGRRAGGGPCRGSTHDSAAPGPGSGRQHQDRVPSGPASTRHDSGCPEPGPHVGSHRSGLRQDWASAATRGCCVHLPTDRPRPGTQAALLLLATTRPSQAAPGCSGRSHREKGPGYPPWQGRWGWRA